MTEGTSPESLPDGTKLQIRLPPELEAGVWSNFAVVRHSPYEFTLDFIRLDFSGSQSPRRGVVVQRVNMSPQFVEQLISALSDNMSKFASNLAPSSLETLGESSDDEPDA
ncbi:DUF3467 domain-containing protein [Candidatus Poriferisodalis sp.]|uniref:DUF3467 domain-containing protein n=1 Tax=Candidatus Poriferisodalis sp. TaxID=3101277 RepID=UPI003B017B33